MLRFKLKTGLTFAAEGTQYLVRDAETHSTFRIGQVEYQILRHFEEKTNLEEVRYLFRTHYGQEVPRDTLQNFIYKAIKLNILEAEADSLWNRISPSTAFTFQIKFFDPTPILDRVLRRGGMILSSRGLFLGAAVMLCGLIILLTNNTLLTGFFHAGLGEYLVAAGAVGVFAINHEMAHGLAARGCGFDVKSIGFHLHYFMPSLYCKILRPADASRRALLIVLLAGSFSDLLGVATLLCMWRVLASSALIPAAVAVWVGTIAGVMLIKILLVQLNPLWLYSDGYYAAELLIGNRFAWLRNRKRGRYREQ